MRQPLETLRVLNTLTLKQIFWKTKTFFKKLKYHYLVRSAKTEIAKFPYKIVLSETSVGKYKKYVQKGALTNNGVLLVTTYFSENLVLV